HQTVATQREVVDALLLAGCRRDHLSWFPPAGAALHLLRVKTSNPPNEQLFSGLRGRALGPKIGFAERARYVRFSLALGGSRLASRQAARVHAFTFLLSFGWLTKTTGSPSSARKQKLISHSGIPRQTVEPFPGHPGGSKKAL